MDEATKRVTGVLDEYQKKQDDFLLDSAIKIGGGALVGLTFGIMTKRFIKIRNPVFVGSFVGAGMSIERYSQQLSAPYVEPPTCEIALNPTRVFAETWHGNLPPGLIESVKAMFASSKPSDPPAAESTPEVVAEEPVIALADTETLEEAAPVESEVVEEAAPIEAEIIEDQAAAVSLEIAGEDNQESVSSNLDETSSVAEVIESTVEEVESISIVDIVAQELKEELNKVAVAVEILAEEVETVASDVDQVAEIVEHAAHTVDAIPIAHEVEEVAIQVETAAQDVEAAATLTAEIAVEVKEATE